MTPFAPPRDAEALRAMYPESDGKPLAENTKQLRWITLLYDNLRAMFADRDDVFVAGDNLWYPVEHQPKKRQAPDVYVVFGRPKGDRGSYMQWREDGAGATPRNRWVGTATPSRPSPPSPTTETALGPSVAPTAR